MMTLENEIFNMNNFINYTRNHELDDEEFEDLAALAGVSDFSGLTCSVELFSLIDDIATIELNLDTSSEGKTEEEIYSTEEMNEETIANEFSLDFGYTINRIDRNSDLLNGLIQWYGGIDNVVNHVRSAVLHDGSLYFATGVGYDWFTADVLNLRDAENARALFNKVITGAPLSEADKAEIETARK